MNIVLSIIDKIYSDSNTLSMIYIIGAVLLFIFIIMLIFSLRQPKETKKTEIIEEPDISTKEEKNIVNEISIKENDKTEEINESKDTTTHITEALEQTENVELSSVLDKAEEKISIENETNELVNLSSEIPDVDDFVDNVVKKTYEKNEQFSSIFVGDGTSTIKLDNVLDKLNVDEDIKNEIVPKEEKTVMPIEEEIEIENKEIESKEEIKVTNNFSNLDALKKAMEDKKKEVNLKQNDLKSKLDSLKTNKPTSKETMNAEDLLKKLNSLKNTK